ncbi:MAG: M1 family aminopeptidase [Ignavibacteria bacterium]|nr:M1 family aminopeptidase [Ignavibacteria bacterium]
MKECNQRRSDFALWNRVAFSSLVSLLVSTSAVAQFSWKGFGKDGRFVAPDHGISPPRIYQSVSSYVGPQPFDMLHYSLDLSLSLLTDSLGGKTTMTLVLTSAVDSVVLHAVGLQLDTVRVDRLQKSISFNPMDETFTIFLNGMRNPGDTLRIEINYERIPGYPRPSSRQGYYYFRDTLVGLPSNLGYTFSEPSDARFWMPCYDEPWEKATAEINLTIPVGYLAASNGKLSGTTDNGDGTVTWHWREDHQIATYLMCITASAFTIPTLSYVTSTNDTIPVQYYVWSADSVECAAYLPTVREMVVEYSRLFDEYPFDKYGMTAIIPFTYLGMEHQSLTTINWYFKTDRRVVSHELAHQWWGDLVTCGTWADIWLNESFATYSEALWQEHVGGMPALKSYMRDTLSEFQFASWQGAIYDPVGQGFNLFDRVVYSKGAWVLHTLRGAVGDSTFFNVLRAYREKYQSKSAITAEFAAVVDSVMGIDMSWFFDQWIYGPGWPTYSYSYSWGNDTVSLVIDQLQSTSWPTYKMPMQVRVHHPGGSTDFVVLDSMRTQSFGLPLSTQPDSVELDPNYWILKQIAPPPLSVDVGETPTSYRLDQNYPNPFNPTTSIRFALPSSGFVRLEVFSTLGEEVTTLVAHELPAGIHAVNWNARDLASGVYLYRLRAGDYVDTKKLLLLK